MHRDVNVPNFTGLGVFVAKTDVTSRARYRLKTEIGERRYALPPGKRPPAHAQSAHELRKSPVAVDLVEVDVEFLAEKLTGILDSLSAPLVEFTQLCQVTEGLRPSVTTAGQPRLKITGGDGPIVLTDEFDPTNIITFPGVVAIYNIYGRCRGYAFGRSTRISW